VAKKVNKSSNRIKPKETAEVLITKEVYGKAPEKHHFILKDGRKLKDLKDLTNSLVNMKEDIFKHHVNELKNDFSSWVKDVFNEKYLAEELKKFHSSIETELTLQKHFEKKLSSLINKLISK